MFYETALNLANLNESGVEVLIENIKILSF
jgi:hypothetical protein